VGVSTTPITASAQSQPNRPLATRNCGVSYSVPQSTVPYSKYRFISDGRHSLRHARLAIGRAVPAPALRPGGVIHGLWWRSGVSSRSTFDSKTPPRPRPQFICSSFGEGRVFPEFVAGLPACRSDRPHGQPASISQHQPASSLLVNFDRGIGSLLHLESQPAGHWPWDMGHGHRPSPHRPSCQTAAGPPERSTTNVRATEAVSRRRKDGRRRAQGHKGTRHKAQGHNTNRSIVGRPAPLWSWTRYCLMNREGCGSTAVPSQTSRAWCRHRIIESSNH